MILPKSGLLMRGTITPCCPERDPDNTSYTSINTNSTHFYSQKDPCLCTHSTYSPQFFLHPPFPSAKRFFPIALASEYYRLPLGAMTKGVFIQQLSPLLVLTILLYLVKMGTTSFSLYHQAFTWPSVQEMLTQPN